MRNRFAWVLAAVNLLIVVLVGGWMLSNTSSRPPAPTPTATVPSVQPTVTATGDPSAWYRRLPDARTMPACPTSLPPELIRYYYRNCPTGGATS